MASETVAVRVTFDLPSATVSRGLTEREIFPGGPEVNSTVVEAEEEPHRAVTVAVPGLVGAVRIA